MKNERINQAGDSRLADYRDVKDPVWLRERRVFLAEGRTVVRTLCELAEAASEARSPRLRAPKRERSSRLRRGLIWQRKTQDLQSWVTLPGTYRVRSVLLTDTALAALEPTLEQLPAGTPGYVVARDVLDAVAGVRFHQGCVAAVDVPQARDWRALARDSRHLAILESVSDPDNVGAVFRSARAFGADAVLLAAGCASPHYRKAVRTSMGAALCVPFAEIAPWPHALRELRDNGFTVCALVPDAEQALPTAPVREKVAWLLGAEGDGLSAGARAAATRAVRIPMNPEADSINVAVAAAIAMQRIHERGAQ